MITNSSTYCSIKFYVFNDPKITAKNCQYKKNEFWFLAWITVGKTIQLKTIQIFLGVMNIVYIYFHKIFSSHNRKDILRKYILRSLNRQNRVLLKLKILLRFTTFSYNTWKTHSWKTKHLIKNKKILDLIAKNKKLWTSRF